MLQLLLTALMAVSYATGPTSSSTNMGVGCKCVDCKCTDCKCGDGCKCADCKCTDCKCGDGCKCAGGCGCGG
jgi:hypothetical protein